jgi:hypothetical protein
VKIDQAIQREAELAAAMFEEEEMERFRSQRSFVYRHGAGVSMSCLAVFMLGLFMTLVFKSGVTMWVCIGAMALGATVLVYTLLRIIRPDDTTQKVVGRVALYYIAIAVLLTIINFIK